MDEALLQFQGTRNVPLLVTILAGTVAALVLFGIWQLIRRRSRYGLLCLAAGLGPPVIIPAMIAEAILRYWRGDRRGARASAVAAGAIVLATALAAGVLLATGFSASAGWVAAVGLEVALAVGVFYASAYSALGTRRMALLMALRCAAILALLMVLFKPALAFTAGEEASRPALPILVDRSGSMGAIDRAGAPDRYQQALQSLAAQAERINKHFRPVWYHFADSPEMVESLEQLAALKPAGKGTTGTDIAAAIRSAAGQFGTTEVPGMLLISDGIHNAGDDPVEAVVDSGLPVFAAGVGLPGSAPAGRPNARVLSAATDWQAILNNAAKITARLRISGLANTPLRIELHEKGIDEPVATAEVTAKENVQIVAKELSWTPKDRTDGPDNGRAADIRKLTLRLVPEASEAVTDDNECRLHVLITQPKIRVLYVEGTIRPEYRSLRRYLDSDPNVQFMGLVRFMGTTFQAQGKVGGRKLDHLPTTDEDCGLFDVIVLGDVDSTFWTRGRAGRLGRLRKFVNDGGGLLMIGGHNSFGPGGYDKTELAEVLPVVMGSRSQGQETTPFVPKLTAAGRAHPIFEGIGGYFPGPGPRQLDAGLARLSKLKGCVRVVSHKPGSALLAIHPLRSNSAGPLVVLAAGRFGAGRTVAFTGDTTWQWDMPMRGLGIDSPYQRFWGQMVRWLANVETKRRAAAAAVVMRCDRPYIQIGENARITALVQNARGKPAAGAGVACTITPLGKAEDDQTLSLSQAADPGFFATQFTPRRDGRYRLKVTAVDQAGQEIGADELTLQVAEHLAEMDDLSRSDALLGKLADPNEGGHADVSALGELVGRLIEHHRQLGGPGEATRITPLFHFTWLFFLFAGLLTTEWLLRRRWQLR